MGVIDLRVSPGDIADMEDSHDEATEKNPNVSNIYSFYTGNGKGVASTLDKAVLEYPIELIQIQCKMVWMLSIKALQ